MTDDERKSEFIKNARLKHGNTYDYSKVEYLNSKTKVKIICNKHGEFEQTPNCHLNGQGCPICGNERKNISRKLTLEDFLRKASEVHKNKFNYDKVNFNSTHDKITITCPIHGDFQQEVRRHLSGFGCSKCSKKHVLTKEEVITRLKEIYGDKFIYDKMEYKSRNEKVKLICPKHGEFEMWAHEPYPSNPCPKCGTKNCSSEEFIEKAKETHGDRYDYSQTIYNGAIKKVNIICKKHGEFKQVAYAHLRGQGCPQCNASKLENEIEVMLTANNIEYVKQAKFEWLGRQSLDFYLPQHNIAIECQGEQHYRPIKFFGGVETFIKNKTRDENKRLLCEKNGVKLIYFSNEADDKTYNNKEDILKIINDGALMRL